MFDNTLNIRFSAECALPIDIYEVGGLGKGYTNKLSEFTFFLENPQAVTNLPLKISKSNLLWDFGDGTISKTLTAKHVYNYPGEYTVSLVAYNSAGDPFLSTFTQQISVTNFIDDKLSLLSGGPFNIPAGTVGTDNNTIVVQRTNSLQSAPSVEQTGGYTLNLYASGSSSNKLDVENFKNNKWSHIDQTWSFYRQEYNNDGTINNIPIDNIKTTNNENLYYKIKPSIDLDSSTIIKALSTDINSVFVGTSGSANFFYADDTPKNLTSKESPIFLFISTDTKNFPLPEDSIKNYNEINSINAERFEHLKLTIPVKVRFNPAKTIQLTTTGILNSQNTFALSGFKYVDNESALFVNLGDEFNNTTENYPPLTANSEALKRINEINIVNISLIKSDGRPLSAEFYHDKSAGIRDIAGSWRGYFIPREHADNVTLSASVTLVDPLFFPHDLTHSFISAPSSSKVVLANLNQTWNANETVSANDLSESHIIPSHGLYGFAVVPVSDNSISDNRRHIWATDIDKDRIYRFDTNREILSAIVLSAFQTIIEPQSTISAIFDFSDTEPYGIASNKDKDIWVTLHKGLSTIKIDNDSGYITQIILPSILTPGLSANILKPWAVDTDSENNIWVSYGATLCCFIEKFGDDRTNITKFQLTGHKIQTPAGDRSPIPKDLICDKMDDVWFITNNSTGRKALTTFSSDPAYVTRVPLTSAGLAGDFLRYTFNAGQLSSVQANQIIEFTSFDPLTYNGEYLVIEKESEAELIVRPHPVVLNHLTLWESITPDPGTVTNVYDSDLAYKVRKDGTELYAVSGLYKPNYITIDINQNLWVAHDLNSITLITSGGTLSSTYIAGDPSLLITDNLANSLSAISQNLSGIAADLGNHIWAINSIENKLYFVNIDNGNIRSANITNTGVSGLNTFQSYGDWNGQNWYNKYTLNEMSINIVGDSTIDVLPVTGRYGFSKFNEDFDMAEMYKDLRFQDFLKNYENLFDNFIGQAVGDVDSNQNSLGKRIFERISNFPKNISDADTCTIQALYSLYQQVGEKIDNYKFVFPSNLKRVVDFVSIPQSKIWGTRSNFERDFDSRQTTNSNYAKNIGAELNVLSSTLTVGDKIIAKQIFDRQYSLINVSYVSAGAAYNSHPDYVTVGTTAAGLSTYPLSSYDISWNWNLDKTITGVDIAKYYDFYTHVSTTSDLQLEGVIDWSNKYTTIIEDDNSVNEWERTFGTVDALIDIELRQGLNLFDTALTPTVSTLQYGRHPYWHKTDNIGAVSATYGMNLLYTGYEGNALCARRSSDGALSGFGYDSDGLFNSAQLSTFTGTGSAFVRALFDQTNSKDMFQLTDALQPIIMVDGLSIIDTDGNPAMRFTGTTFLSSNIKNILYFLPNSNDISFASCKAQFDSVGTAASASQIIYSEFIYNNFTINRNNILIGASANKLYQTYYIDNLSEDGSQSHQHHVTQSTTPITLLTNISDIAYEFDHTAGGIIYISSVVDGSSLDITSSLAETDTTLGVISTIPVIGKSKDGNGFHGLLSELILINKSLMQEEIEILSE